ncbi:MAG TPA: hypothetical protein PLY93_04155, partial [Turneriella sp.]|nr:hypothetical protein [Turneriella sp.]
MPKIMFYDKSQRNLVLSYTAPWRQANNMTRFYRSGGLFDKKYSKRETAVGHEISLPKKWGPTRLKESFSSKFTLLFDHSSTRGV